jgi:SAM-dependent methyltransferase
MYRFGFTPWDSGVPPPELKELIEGPQARTPGKALDLGCGTGTNAIYMTQHGWDVTAIDFVPRAIASAKAKAAAAKVSPRLLVGDVTRLGELGVQDGYTLLFDLGCFHAIPQDRRDAYVAGATKSASSGGDFLLWGFYRKPNWETNAMVSREEIEQRFTKDWELLRAWGGEQPDRFPGRWYHLKRR